MSTEKSRNSVTIPLLIGTLLLMSVVFGGVALASHEPNGYISGNVTTESGNADDIYVVIKNNTSGNVLHNVSLDETTGNTEYNVSVPGNHTYDVIYKEKISRTATYTNLTVQSDTEYAFPTVTLNRSDSYSEVKGFITTEGSATTAHVTIINNNGTALVSETVPTGSEYSFVILGGMNPYTMNVTATGHNGATRDFNVSEGYRTTQNFTLTKEQPGRIVGTATMDEPTAGNITIKAIDGTGTVINTTEVPNGTQYDIAVPEGTYRVEANAPEHTKKVFTGVTVTQGNNTTVDVHLNKAPPYISGAIFTERNDYTGNVTVTIENTTGTVINSTVLQYNSEGFKPFNMTLNQTGDFTVTADSPDHETATKNVTVNNSSDSASSVDIQLKATNRGNFSVTAATVDGNATQMSVKVQELGKTKFVADGGQAEFDAPTGTYNITVSASGYVSQTVTLTNTAGTVQSTYVELKKANGTIEVIVDSPNADATQMFNVSIVGQNITKTTQQESQVEFNVSAGTYTLEADATGFVPDNKTISINSNETVTMQLAPYQPSNISVSMKLENTTAASVGNVTVQETGNTYSIGHNNTTKITGLRSGTYTLVAGANGHINQSTEVYTDMNTTPTVNISLQYDSGQTGFLGINASTEDGNASQITVSIQETGQTFFLNDGGSTTVELQEGTYTITADADGYYSNTTTVQVDANTTQAINFNLQVNDTIVVDAEGVRIVDGNSYWVGQQFWREGLGNYTEVRWRNKITGQTLNRSIDADDIYRDSVKNITSQAGPNSNYAFYGVNSSGNTTKIADVFLGIQTLNASFDPNSTVDQVRVNFNSNRGDGYWVLVNQDNNDTNQLTTQQIRNLFAQNFTTEIRTVNGNNRTAVFVSSGSVTETLNVSSFERADYNFYFNVSDTPAKAQAEVTLVVAPFEDEADATIVDGGRYWLGQRLEASNNIENSETVSVYTQNDVFVQELTSDEFGVVQIRTTALGTGNFYIKDSDGNKVLNFSVKKQRLTASFTDSSVLNGGPQTESGLTVDSNRVGYTLLVSGNYTNKSTTKQLSSSQLESAFDTNTTTINGTTYAVFKKVSNLQTFILDADELGATNYTFTLRPRDAQASATAELEVTAPVEGQALFNRQFYTHNRGDIAEIEVEFSGDNRNATIKIGRYGRVGYELTAKITRDVGVGTAVLKFNTSAAGQGTPSEALYTESNNVEITVLDETKLPGDRKLAAARYLMELKVDDKTTALSTLNLFKAGIIESKSYGMPPTVSSVGNETVFMNSSVEMNTIGSKSYVAVGFKVTGLEIQLNDSQRTPSDFQPTSAFAQKSGISVDIVKDDAGLNTPPEEVNVANALKYHYIPLNDTSEGNNTALAVFIFSPSEFTTTGDGTYHATMRIDGKTNAFVQTDMNSTTNFTFVESETSFDRHWSGQILVLPESNQTFTGTTTLPPGTKLTHEIRSENVRFPFYQSKTITVSDNQTFNVTYDLGGVPVGLEFNTSIPSQMNNKSVNVVSEIVPYPPGQMTNVTVFTRVNGEPHDATIRFDGTSVTTSGSPPLGTTYLPKDTYRVQGTVQMNGTNYTVDQTVTLEENNADLIVNLNKQNGEITRGDPREIPDKYKVVVRITNASSGQKIDGIVSLGGTEKITTNGTATFMVTAGEYQIRTQGHNYESTVRDIQVIEDGKIVTIEMQPNKVEPVQTTTPEPTNTTTTTPGQPGFGVAIALVALVGAFIFARRRD